MENLVEVGLVGNFTTELKFFIIEWIIRIC